MPTRSDAGFNTLVSPGWRLIWAGQDTAPGNLIVRLVLKVRPRLPWRTASELFQVGVSRDPATVRTCLTYGLDGGSGGRQRDRVINGIRYAVWTNGDAGMSQGINATDLRAVVAGACYAVERVAAGESASEGDPSVTLSEARGASELDATLASLRITAGRVAASSAVAERNVPAAADR